MEASMSQQNGQCQILIAPYVGGGKQSRKLSALLQEQHCMSVLITLDIIMDFA